MESRETDPNRDKYVSEELFKADAANADMASVGYDRDAYAMLINSGTALSQMSQAELGHIRKHFTADSSTKYKDTVVDNYLMSIGLPPSSSLQKYRTAYQEYSSGGGFDENYGYITNDRWNLINDQWKKDWEYGLSAQDTYRKLAGMPPESYDSMYSDTLLDDELKARGLPPSKLLNGKLGNAVNEYVATGGISDVYPNMTDADWSKVVDIWKKDWDYTMSPEDIERKNAGLPPVGLEVKYENTLLDDELKAKGLPPSKLLRGSLGEKVNSYYSSGAVKDAYPDLTNDDWNAIVDIWKKDWEYTLTAEDEARKKAGKPPVEYDDMYEDTMLDEQLKDRGLPPSKLLSGKLGEQIGEYYTNAETYDKLFQDAAKTYMRKSGSGEYSLTDAFEETLNKPEYQAFAGSHLLPKEEIPDRFDNKYRVMVENKYGDKVQAKDENGNLMYDLNAWQEDVKSVAAKNAKIDADDFAFTYDDFEKYFEENATYFKAEGLAEQMAAFYAKRKDATVDYDKLLDRASEYVQVNEGNGITLDYLYPDQQFTEEQREFLTPYVTKANDIMLKSGVDAANNYLKNDMPAEIKSAINVATDEYIIESYRTQYGDVEGYNDPGSNHYKTDDQILDSYYESVKRDYGLSDEETASVRTHKTTVDEIMRSKITTTEAAEQFGLERLQRELASKGLPTTQDGLLEIIDAGGNLTEEEAAEANEANRASNAKKTVADLWEHYITIGDIEDGASPKEAYDEYVDGGYNVPSIDRIKELHPDFTDEEAYEYGVLNALEPSHVGSTIEDTITDNLDFAVGSIESEKGETYSQAIAYDKNWSDLKNRYTVEAFQYLPDFSEKTSNMDEVNAEFERIIKEQANTLTDEEAWELASKYATDDEKRMLVYASMMGKSLWDQSTPDSATSESAESSDKVSIADTVSHSLDSITPEAIEERTAERWLSDSYLNGTLLHRWDMEKRKDKAQSTRTFFQESDSRFINGVGQTLQTVVGALASMGEGLYNLGQDTVKIIGGKEILSSSHSTWGQDSTAKIGENVRKNAGDFWAWAYNLTPSMIQSGVTIASASLTGGASALVKFVGEWLPLVAMGSESYSSTVENALANGASSGQAYAAGLAAGTAEVLFEKVSLDRYLKNSDAMKQLVSSIRASGKVTAKDVGKVAGLFLKNMGTSGGVEMSEELNTGITNYLTEQLILGLNSSKNTMVQHYIDGGYTRQEAEVKASQEVVKDVFMEALAGLVSGALLSAGSNTIQIGSGMHYDRTGVIGFINTTNNISALPLDDAISIADRTVKRSADGSINRESATECFDALLKRGADAATLMAVRNELSETASDEALIAMDEVIRETRARDTNTLADAARRVFAASEKQKAKSKEKGQSTKKPAVETMVNSYLDNVSTTVQTADKAKLGESLELLKNGFVDDVLSATGAYDARVNGADTIANYINSQSQEGQAAIEQKAEEYLNHFKSVETFSGNEAQNYANRVAAVAYAIETGDLSKNAKTLFGLTSTQLSEAFKNAVLNTNSAASVRFVNTVLDVVGVLNSMDGTTVVGRMRGGSDAMSFASAVVALSERRAVGSLSRSVYNYVSRFGASRSLVTLLAQANRYDTMSAQAKDNANDYVRRNGDAFRTADTYKASSDAYAKARMEYENKRDALAATREKIETSEAEAGARVARYQAEYDAYFTESMADGTMTIPASDVQAAESVRRELNDAQAALDNLRKDNAKKLTSAENDLKHAARQFLAESRSFRTMLDNYSAAYTLMFGSVLESMKAGNSVSRAEIDRLSALAENGTREDLNDINAKIIAAEKRAATAFGTATGADVRVVKFTDAFCHEHGIERTDAPAFEENGVVYMNDSVFEAKTGYALNVLKHEYGHVAKLSTNNYDGLKKFAMQYQRGIFGDAAVEAQINLWMESEGLSREKAEDELVAEFVRTALLTDQRAISALCKSAPVMSVRLMQWLNTMKSTITKTSLRDKTIDQALRMFAKAMSDTNVSTATENVNSPWIDRARDAVESANVYEDTVETETPRTETQPVSETTESEETVPEAQTEAQTEIETPAEPQAEETEENVPEQAQAAPTLPFDMPEKAMRLINTFVQGKARYAVDGKVSPTTNDAIRSLVKNQVTKAAAEAGVTVSEETLNEYAEQFTLPEFETSGESWINSYKPTRAETDFGDETNSTAISDAQYYTETTLLQNAINDMTDNERAIYGDPHLVATSSGPMVVQTVSLDQYTGGAMQGDGSRSIALVADASRFTDGENTFFRRALSAADCVAVVIPNTAEYADVRNHARDCGATVVTYDPSVPTQFENAQKIASEQSGVSYFPKAGMTWEDLISKYGMIPDGMSPRQSERPVPRQTTDTNRVSRAARTMYESPLTSDETAEAIPNWIMRGTGTYTPISNAKTLSKAKSVIERAGSASQAAADLHSAVANGEGRATDLLARAEILYQAAQTDSSLTDIERERIFGDLCIIASDAGRALQLTSELKRMTPEGHIEYLEQVGKRMGDRYEKRTGKKLDPRLTDEEKQRLKTAATEEQRKEIDEEISRRFGEEAEELTFLDRVRNWRYFSMLGNPRTHFRNIIGNTLMIPVARTKDSISALYQGIAGIDKENRTAAGITGRVDADVRAFVEQQLKSALPKMQGVSSKYMDTASKESDTTESGLKALWKDVASSAITKGRTIFGRGLNKLSSFNSNALEYEDAKFLGFRFRSVMYQLIKARGLDVHNMTEQQTNDIVNYAMEESLRATFRDASALSDALNKLANTNKATRFIMESILPFKKTPINIAKRSIEYSPIGLINGMYKLFSTSSNYKNSMKQIESAQNITEEEKAARREEAQARSIAEKIAAIDRLAEGTTGSILTGLGVLASLMGWVTIGRRDDPKDAFEQSLGKNSYSLNIGDLSIDLSAFSPVAVPLLEGVALTQSLRGERDSAFFSSVIEALCETIDPVTEMSMLSGIADALSGVGYSQSSDYKSTRWFSSIAGNAVESYIGQFVPTFVGQVARVADPYARSYTAGDDYWASKIFGSEVGSAVKSLQNKVGLGWLSEPKVDLHGDPVRNYTNWGAGVLHVANNLILPATIKVDNKNDIDDELVRLYGVVDTADIFPTKPSRNLGYVTNKETGENVTFKLTNDAEYMQYQREVGQTAYDMLEELMASSEYNDMTDAQKAEAVESVIDTAAKVTKKRWKAVKMEGLE